MPVSKTNIIIGAGWVKLGPYDCHDAYMVNLGATQDGVEIVADREFIDITADQVGANIAKFETHRKITIRTNLLEATLANLAIAWGYNPEADISSGTFSLKAPSVNEWKLQFIGKGTEGKRRIATFWKVVSIGSAGHKYVKDDKVVYPVEFEVLYDFSKAGQELGKIVDATPDTTPPTVLSISPANGATGVPISTSINVTWSEHIQFESFKKEFTLKKTSDGTIVSGSFSYNTTTKVATFTPSSNLAAATEYTVTIQNVYDLEENKLATTFTSRFTTA